MIPPGELLSDKESRSGELGFKTIETLSISVVLIMI